MVISDGVKCILSRVPLVILIKPFQPYDHTHGQTERQTENFTV